MRGGLARGTSSSTTLGEFAGDEVGGLAGGVAPFDPESNLDERKGLMGGELVGCLGLAGGFVGRTSSSTTLGEFAGDEVDGLAGGVDPFDPESNLDERKGLLGGELVGCLGLAGGFVGRTSSSTTLGEFAGDEVDGLAGGVDPFDPESNLDERKGLLGGELVGCLGLAGGLVGRTSSSTLGEFAGDEVDELAGDVEPFNSGSLFELLPELNSDFFTILGKAARRLGLTRASTAELALERTFSSLVSPFMPYKFSSECHFSFEPSNLCLSRKGVPRRGLVELPELEPELTPPFDRSRVFA